VVKVLFLIVPYRVTMTTVLFGAIDDQKGEWRGVLLRVWRKTK
jgi:hypothetical protein